MAQRHAYDQLVTERYPALLAYATLLTVSPEEATAVTQTALVRVFGRMRRPTTVEAAEAAVRGAIVVAAASGRRGAPVPADEDPGAGGRQRRSEALGRLRGLDPLTRACVVLRHMDELPVAQVAERLRLAPEDVRGHLADARERMGGLVDADAIEDDVMFIEVHGARRYP